MDTLISVSHASIWITMISEYISPKGRSESLDVIIHIIFGLFRTTAVSSTLQSEAQPDV